MHPHLFDLNQEMHEITPVILITNTKVEKKYLNLLIDIAKKISKKKIIFLSKKNLSFDSNKISFYRLKSRSVINRKFIIKKLKSINIKTYVLLNYNYPFRNYKEIKRAIAIFKEKKINQYQLLKYVMEYFHLLTTLFLQSRFHQVFHLRKL